MSGFHDTKRSFQFGLLSIKHVERENKIIYKMNVYMNYGINIGLWNKPYVNSNYYLKLGLKYCLNSKLHGLFAALSVSYIHHLSLAQNKPLPELLQEIEDHQKYLNRTKNVSPIELVHETKERIEEQLSKTGNTIFNVKNTEILMDENINIPISNLNNLRRNAVDKLEEELKNKKILNKNENLK